MSTLNKSLTQQLTNAEYRVLQPIYDLRIGYESYVESPLFIIVVSVLFYGACVAPWVAIDLYGKQWKWIQRYKIQQHRPVRWPHVRKALLLTLWNHVMYILPISVFQWLYQPPARLPSLAPPLFEFLWQHLAALAVFDVEYFFLHWAFHRVRFLYRHVHAVHHEYSSPSSLVTQYLHPLELIPVGVFSATSPWLLGAHPMTDLSFQLFAILVSVDDHIGYDIPFLPHHWFPLWGGSIKHDMHHQKPLTNFAPFYNYLDLLFGTYCPGQLAGGEKTEALLKWEKSHKNKLEQKLTARRRMSHMAWQNAATYTPSTEHLTEENSDEETTDNVKTANGLHREGLANNHSHKTENSVNSTKID